MYPTLIFENFIEQDILSTLVNKIKDKTFLASPNNPNLFNYEIDNQFEHKYIIEYIDKKLKQTIKTFYNKDVIHQAGGSILRYNPGQSIGVHADWAPEDSYVKENNKQVVNLSSVFYLNENFVGGELIFCDDQRIDSAINLFLKPKIGTVIFFDSLKYHYTKEIVSGTKYSYTSFYSLRD